MSGKHGGNGVLHAQEDTTEIDIDHPVEVLFGRFREGHHRRGRAGDIAQNVQSTELSEGEIDHCLRIPGASHISVDRYDALPETNSWPGLCSRDIGKHKACPFGAEETGSDLSRWRACAGDHGNFAS